MLEDENADSFSFTDEFFAWRDWKIDTARLQYRRQFVTSFGSCSFDEPREDLRALQFLLPRSSTRGLLAVAAPVSGALSDSTRQARCVSAETAWKAIFLLR